MKKMSIICAIQRSADSIKKPDEVPAENEQEEEGTDYSGGTYNELVERYGKPDSVIDMEHYKVRRRSLSLFIISNSIR